MMLLKQGTAATVKAGPFLDSTDGVTAETGLTINQANVLLSKNGATFAQSNNSGGSPNRTHDAGGWYRIDLDTTDTNTVGTLVMSLQISGACPVWHEYMVLPANVHDSLVGGTDYLDTNAAQIEGADPTDTIRDSVVDDATRLNASKINTGIPEVTPGADGGLPTVDADGRVSSDLTAIDGQSTDDNNATLHLKQLHIVNDTPNPAIYAQGGVDGAGLEVRAGAGSPGFKAVGGGPAGPGILAEGGVSAGAGMKLTGTDGGVDLDADLSDRTMALVDGAISSAKIATDAITADKVAANAIGASELPADALAEIANALAELSLAGYEATAKNGARLGDMVAAARAGALGRLELSGTTLTLYEVDGATVLARFTVAEDYSRRSAPT